MQDADEATYIQAACRLDPCIVVAGWVPRDFQVLLAPLTRNFEGSCHGSTMQYCTVVTGCAFQVEVQNC